MADTPGDRDVLEIVIHEGPCLAVTLNDRQDYFGQTVNIAARVQGRIVADLRERAGYGSPVIVDPRDERAEAAAEARVAFFRSGGRARSRARPCLTVLRCHAPDQPTQSTSGLSRGASLRKQAGGEGTAKTRKQLLGG